MIAFSTPTPHEQRIDWFAYSLTHSVAVAKQCPAYLLMGYSCRGTYSDHDPGDEDVSS